MKTLKIAGIIVNITASDQIRRSLVNQDLSRIIHESFYDFMIDSSNGYSDINWNLKFIDEDIITKKCMYQTSNLKIFNNGNGDYVYAYNDKESIPQYVVCKDNFSNCTFFLSDFYTEAKLKEKTTTDLMKLCLYNIFREMFFYYATIRGYIPIHSASIIYNNKAYLFSARSGVGKSTHTNMWNKYYNAEILDGDVCLCNIINENGVKKVYSHGLPWCGTSNLYTNKSVEFGGIIFLKRANENKACCLDNVQTGKGLFLNNFVVYLDENIADSVVLTINELSECINGYELCCLPNKEAVDVIKEIIT